MSSNLIFMEGGGSRELDARCREGMKKLLANSGFSGRQPGIVACGSRSEAYKDFKTAHERAKGAYVALLVDSEDPVKDIDKPWEHLKARQYDDWERPAMAADEQVLLMTTCMETWIVADREALHKYFNKAKDVKGDCPQESALPALVDLEIRHRHTVQDALMHSTRNCSNTYAKGKRSFEVLGMLDPNTLAKRLPSFERIMRILTEKL